MKKIYSRKIITVIGTILILLVSYRCQDSELQSQKNVQIVPDEIASSVAEHFNPHTFFNDSNKYNNAPTRSSLSGDNKIKAKFVFNDSNGNPALYIFNYEDEAGFIFISADYQLQPVLAFIEKGEFKKGAAPAGLINWVNKTMENIEIVRKGQYDNSKLAGAAWQHQINEVNAIIAKSNPAARTKSEPPLSGSCTDNSWVETTVGPLLPTTWGQACTYNNLCPNLGCSLGCISGNALTGCVATSTAQIVRYWQPANGYSYNYASMPASFGNGEVQRLMRDIGLPANVNTSYGCNGSGADASRVPNALKNNFGFTSANFGNYSYSSVENDIANYQRPVLLDGCRTQTGHWFIINWWYSYSDCHEWVADGTKQISVRFCDNGEYAGGNDFLYFHMNWGWHEIWGDDDYIGWFAFSDWNIPGANRNYQYAHDMTTGIHP
jgi:hypothetical protein